MESKKSKVSFPDESKKEQAAAAAVTRTKVKHKTIQPNKDRAAIQDKLKKLEKNKGNLAIIPEDEPFHRKEGRTKSLIERNKLGFKEAMDDIKLRVGINNLIEETQGLPNNKYKVLSVVGEGSFGVVYQAENLVTHSKVAIKKISKSKENEVDDLEIKNEITILKNLDHPNICKIIEFYSTPRAYYLIQSFCSLGELYDQLKFKFDENQLAVLFYQIFSGLAYLHSKNILHRDLKLENIMIQEIETDLKTQKKYMWIKIIDFGAAKIFGKHRSEKAIVGSSYYIAPEVLEQSYNEKCDIWSIGVILYMLIVGRAPFDGQDDDEILESIKKGDYNKNHSKLVQASKQVQDLIKCLLERDPKKRYSASQALKHEWFKVFKGKSLYFNIEKETIQKYVDRLYDYPFHINYRLQQMVLAFIVHNLPDTNETKDILKIFRQFNENDDGKLTKQELYNALCQFKKKELVKKDIEDIWMILDLSKKNYLEFEEFLIACMDLNYVTNEDNLLYAFNFCDKDNRGQIKIENLLKIFTNDEHGGVSESEFRKVYAEIDLNSDGMIDYKEFKTMMTGY